MSLNRRNRRSRRHFQLGPKSIKNTENAQKWVHAKGRRERRFRRFKLSPGRQTTFTSHITRWQAQTSTDMHIYMYRSACVTSAARESSSAARESRQNHACLTYILPPAHASNFHCSQPVPMRPSHTCTPHTTSDYYTAVLRHRHQANRPNPWSSLRTRRKYLGASTALPQPRRLDISPP